MNASHRWKPSLLAFAATAAGFAAGCADGPVKQSPEALAAVRERLVLAAEPAGALTALDWREQQTEDAPVQVNASPAEDERITLVGQVGGMPNPFGDGLEPEFPWKPGVAAFFLVDPATAAEFEEHAGEAGDDHAADCPFCAREAATKLPAVALVTFSEDGKPIGVDARELFGIQAGDLVVVRGTPTQAGDLLMIQADDLFVRK